MKNRNTSLDLLKILAIFLIVSFHASYKGIPANAVSGMGSINQILYYTFYHFGELGVNLFMLITGFFLVNSRKVGKDKIISFVLDIYFFSTLSIFMALAMKKYTFHLQDLLPVTFSYYWYITVYLIIYVLSPFINNFIHSLSKKSFQKLLIAIFCVFSIIPTLAGIIVGGTEEFGFYNRFVWLLFMYLVGGYLYIYQKDLAIMNNSPKKIIHILLKIVFFVAIFAYFAIQGNINTRLFNITPTYFWGPNSVVMCFASILLFSLFYNLKIANNKLITVLSSSTLSIYLLHEHPKLVHILWQNIFPISNFLYSKKLFLIILVASLTVLAIGTSIHYIKKYTFDKIIKVKLLKLGIR